MSFEDYISEDPFERMDDDEESNYQEWSKAVFEQEANPNKDEAPQGGGISYDYEFKGKTTPKAQFYVTAQYNNHSMFGFWVPKSAIISESSKSVKIAPWCEIKEIEFT